MGPATEDFPESQALAEALLEAEVEFEQIDNRSQQNCFYAQGDADARQSPNQLAIGLKQSIGVGRKGLPSEDNYMASVARLAKIYIADINGMDFRSPDTKVKFAGTLSSSVRS